MRHIFIDIRPYFGYERRESRSTYRTAGRVTPAAGASAVPAGGGSSLPSPGGLGIDFPWFSPECLEVDFLGFLQAVMWIVMA